MPETILDEIVRVRKERLECLGPEEGTSVPAKRTAPAPLPFSEKSETGAFLICEIKRRSPSKGNLNSSLDPLRQAEIYLSRGAGHISVLTESEYFGGSLDDLMAVRKAFPAARILRKDFLLSREDIDVTYRSGADAFLLIASVLDEKAIRDLYEYGESLGLTPFVELHSPEEAAAVKAFAPKLTGVNCRDLKTFTIDPLGPLKLKAHIDWPCRIVYESGIHSPGDARFALGIGFDGILVGEAVVKDDNLASGLIQEFGDREYQSAKFVLWRRLYAGYGLDDCGGRPLVKICGMTRLEDAREAVRLGADMIGFVLAESPRRIDRNAPPEQVLEEFREIDALKIGVVIMPEDEDEADAYREKLRGLIDKGLLDGIQFHGDEKSDEVEAFPGFKALTVGTADDLEKAASYRPRPVLLDAFHADRSGMGSKTLDPTIIEKARKGASGANLWLAGGVNPDNLEEILTRYRPELIDIASGVEKAPGIKDHEKMGRIFDIVRNYVRSREESS